MYQRFILIKGTWTTKLHELLQYQNAEQNNEYVDIKKVLTVMNCMSKLTHHPGLWQMEWGQSWTQFRAFINHQRFQFGEAPQGFIGGKMNQVLATHNVQLLKRGKVAQPLQIYYFIKSLYPHNFKGNEVFNLVQAQERVVYGLCTPFTPY